MIYQESEALLTRSPERTRYPSGIRSEQSNTIRKQQQQEKNQRCGASPDSFSVEKIPNAPSPRRLSNVHLFSNKQAGEKAKTSQEEMETDGLVACALPRLLILSPRVGNPLRAVRIDAIGVWLGIPACNNAHQKEGMDSAAAAIAWITELLPNTFLAANSTF